ncbi:MAG: hypothetical protein ACFFCP_19275 [Promethearchaeota archaeon]
MGRLSGNDDDHDHDDDYEKCSIDAIIDQIGGVDKYLVVCGRIEKRLKRDDLSDEVLIELAIDAVTNIDHPSPTIFMELASRLPLDVDKGLAGAVLARLPDGEYWIHKTIQIEEWDLGPAIENLCKINPPGFLEYLISVACLAAKLGKGLPTLEAIYRCISLVTDDVRHRENLSVMIENLINSPKDDIEFHIVKLRDYEL